MKYDLINELDENDVVDLTPAWLQTEYNRLNTSYFDGKLGDCSFGLFTTGKGAEGGVLGWFKITGTGIYFSKSSRRMFTKDMWGDKNYITKENFASVCKPRIELNGNYRWSKKAALSTLIHEMCHYYCNMNGWRPVQHHGNEFRSIAFRVSQKSNEFFTVERIAKAEQMNEMEINSVFAEKKKRRAAAKASRLIVVVMYMKNGEVRLMNANNWNLVGEVERIESKEGRCLRLLTSQDPELVALLFEKGYRHEMRTYRYWDITGKPIVNELDKFKFTTRIDNGTVMEMTRRDLKEMIVSAFKKAMLNEISSADAYNKFYKDKVSPEQWNAFMAGAPTMTPLHKLAIDVMFKEYDGWNQQLAEKVPEVWNKLDGEGRQYVIDMINGWKKRGRNPSFYSLLRFLETTEKMPYHTEMKFADNGLIKIYEDDDVLVTCTTSYSASKKYYGDSHWCTASDIAGRFNGFKMFCDYTTEGYSCLVQFISKKNRQLSIQCQFYEDGELDSCCDFLDNDKNMEDVAALFSNPETLNKLLKEIPYGELIEQTIKGVGHEQDYWDERVIAFEQKATASLEKSVNDGMYDDDLIHAIIEHGNDNEAKMGYPIKFDFGTFRIISRETNRMLVNVDCNGANDFERNFVNRAYEESSDWTNDICSHAFVVSANGGTVDGGSNVLARFKGNFARRCVWGTLALLERYSFNDDSIRYDLANLSTGKIIAKEIYEYDVVQGKFYFNKSYNEYENDVWYVIDPNSGEYLGKIEGKPGTMRVNESDIKKMVNECVSLLLNT